MKWRVDIEAQIGQLELKISTSGDQRPLAIIGPNGSGKTTLLRLITGALSPNAGEIEIGERMLFSSKTRVSLPIESRKVGYQPQGYGLFPHLSILDNVAFGLSTGRQRMGKKERRAKALEALTLLGCEGLVARLPFYLSGGEQQRVALARALVLNPEMLLLDEPLAALDAVTRRSVRTFLAQRLRALDCPSLVVTHDVRDVIALDARVLAMEEGRVVQEGALEELVSNPRTPFIAEFVASRA